MAVSLQQDQYNQAHTIPSTKRTPPRTEASILTDLHPKTFEGITVFTSQPPKVLSQQNKLETSCNCVYLSPGIFVHNKILTSPSVAFFPQAHLV